MENTGRRKSGRLHKLITAVFAVVFVASLVSTISTIAAANLFKIQSAELTDLSPTAEGTISSYDDLNIISNVTFHKLNDYTKYTITLKNNDSVEHVIESITDDNANPYVTYDYDQHANEQISAGENLVFVVTAKYTTAVTDINQRAQANNVKFFIHFTDIDEEVILVPNTGVSSNVGNTIRGSVITLTISAVGLTIIGVIVLKKNKKAGRYIIAGIIAVLAIVATATAKAATVEINSFTINASYVLKDKLVVTYTDKNGDEQELISNYNEPANIPDQSKDGYTLTGWEDEDGNPVDLTQPITEDIKIHPVYRAHTYTVKFNGNGATSGEMADLAMTYDEAKTLPANAFDFPGRTYAGWDTEANGSGIHYDNEAEVKNLTAEDNGIVTLYAQWSINPFHIDYDGNGATSGEMATTNCEYDEACELRDNAFEKTGYHFIGWKYDNNDYADKADVKNIIESGTITMVAQWEVNHYTIAFDGNGATSGSTASMAMTYDEEKSLTMNGFEKTGYTFAGWKLGDNEYTDGQTVENLTAEDGATVTLVAKWEAHKFTVIFHANCDDATGNMNNQVVVYGEQTSLAKNAYVRGYYEFMGWTASAEDTTVAYLDEADITNASAEDGAEIHLYAKWRRFDANFGSNSSTLNNTVRNIVAANPNAQTFTKYKDGTPTETQLANATNVSSTIDPTYVWAEGDYMYWWSPDDKPTLRSASSLFANVTLDTVIFESMDTSNVNSLYWTFAASAVKHVRFEDDFDTSKVTTMSGMFGQNNVIEDIYFGTGFSTENVTSMDWLFTNNAKLTRANIENWDVKKVKNLSNAFSGAKLYEADLSKWDTQSLTGIGSAFAGMKHVVFGDKFDTSKVQSMSYAFSRYLSTDLDITMFNTGNVTNMAHMFDGAKINSINLSNFDTSKVTNMAAMFNNCSNLETIDLGSFNTGLVEDMSSILSGTGLTELDITPLETGNVTNMQEMLAHNHKLTSLNISNLDTSKATNMYGLFWDNPLIESLDLSSFNMSGANNIHALIHSMNSLQEITLGKHFTLENVTDYGNFRDATNNVQTVYVDEELDTTTLETKGLFGGSRLVGGAGTTYNVANGAAYNRIDDPDNGKPGYFTIKGARYIRYDGNGADNSEYETMTSHYITNETPLKENAFVRDGYAFNGWNTQADGNGTSYTNKQVISDLVESKTPLTLYATWRKKRDFEGTIDLTRQYSSANVLQLSGSMSGGYVGAAYFNPADLSETCTATSENVADKEAKTGCMKWFIYDDSGSNYKMILDHNTTRLVTFNSSNNNSNPQALYDRLDADTADWDKTKLSTGILTAADVAAISSINSFNPANDNYYPLGTEINSSDGKGRSAFGWLFDYTRECEIHGCDHEVSTGYGHWTTTPVSGDKQKVWLINYFGRLTFTVAKLGNWGIRPIVTVSKSVVSGV